MDTSVGGRSWNSFHWMSSFFLEEEQERLFADPEEFRFEILTQGKKIISGILHITVIIVTVQWTVLSKSQQSP